MRGCLFTLVLAAAVLAAAAWFGASPIATTVITAVLDGSGYHASSSTITATADPPVRLLLGHADQVTIDGTDVTWRTFRAARLVLALDDVDLFGRTAGSIKGTITGAELQTNDAAVPPTADVAIDGSGANARATIRVSAATVDRLVRARFSSSYGVTVTATSLTAPDVLHIEAPGATVEGQLGVDASGALVLFTRLGSAEVFRFDPSFPLRLTGVHVTASGLEMDGILDADSLLGG
jgi:hypothetical protein